MDVELQRVTQDCGRCRQLLCNPRSAMMPRIRPHHRISVFPINIPHVPQSSLPPTNLHTPSTLSPLPVTVANDTVAAAGVNDFPAGWLVYHEKVQSSRVYLHDSTLVTVRPARAHRAANIQLGDVLASPLNDTDCGMCALAHRHRFSGGCTGLIIGSRTRCFSSVGTLSCSTRRAKLRWLGGAHPRSRARACSKEQTRTR